MDIGFDDKRIRPHFLPGLTMQVLAIRDDYLIHASDRLWFQLRQSRLNTSPIKACWLVPIADLHQLPEAAMFFRKVL